MKKQLLILITLCTAVIGYSQTFTENYITYNITSATSPFTVEITDYNNTGGTSVILPSTVNYNTTTYTLTSIANQAFFDKALTSVSIPNSVITIGNQAFISNQLTSVILGNSVASIGGNAFDNNPLLTCVNSKATTPPTIFTGNGDTFGVNNRGNIDLLIPTGTNNLYAAASWTGFNSIQQGLVLNSQFLVDNVTYQVTSVANSTVSVKSYNTAGGNVVNIPATIIGACTSEVFNVTEVSHSAFGNLSTLSSVTLPNSITNIGDYAFSNSGITSVNIPNALSSIGLHVFSNNNLTSIVIPNSVTNIGDYAFRNNQLTNVIIPTNITSIGNGAFIENPLTSVTSLATTPASITTANGTNDTFVIDGDRSGIALYIPANTTDIYVTNPNTGADWSGFNPVTELLAVGDPLVADYISYEVTSSSLNTVEIVDYNVSGGSVVNIPSTVTYNSIDYDVTRIDNQAFQGKGLTIVTIPNSIAAIGSYAFFQNLISEVVIPNSVTSIELGVFESNLLTSITIPTSITSISIGAFKNNPLNSVISKRTTPPSIVTGGSTDSFNSNRSNINLVIPNNTTDDYVTDNGALWTGFKIIHEIIPSTNTLKVTDYNSASGTNVSIPAIITDGSVTYDITEIGISAFFDKSLTSVTIPNSITTIGTSAFNTNNLTSVTIPDSVTIIGSQAFVTNDLTNITIGNNVTEIGFGAFVDNDLTDITIPGNVTIIGPIAFAANPLTSVTTLATIPPTITTGTNDTFEITGNRSNIHLHIPVGTMGAYVTDTGALWTGFNPVIEDAGLSISNFELANDIKIITTQNAIKVLYSNNVNLQNYTIYSITGTKAAIGTENEIPTSFLSSGIYILKLDFDKGTFSKKVLVN